MQQLVPAKLCYNHIGGKLGELLFESFLRNGWITKEHPDDKHYTVTDAGKQEFLKIGVDVSKI
ncbi:ArsR family transcriptional regulator [Pedobacter sp. HMF7647]|uniref:ArsR family transcriptional regulator n=1 Tax=Hufsiella arboris TaxID=2695275 RepID=A0A7K1Y957_9SPHI|nr:ArsR family transcriptional regulator [Hufsiella arboris]MXV50619.1 ArsR family transcriptional regulator [Hufsiella arboris]